jgi:hypothetical protein
VKCGRDENIENMMIKLIYVVRAFITRIHPRKKAISGFDKNEQKVEFGFLWSVLDMNNRYNGVFLNLSDMSNYNNAEHKLQFDLLKTNR